MARFICVNIYAKNPAIYNKRGMDMLLKDKVVIISGVGIGMGQCMAKLAAQEGAKVGLGSRNQGFIDDIVRERLSMTLSST